MSKIVSTHFSTEPFSSAERFDLWRESIAVLFEIDRPDGTEASSPFHAELRAYMLNEVMIASTRSSAAHYNRGKTLINYDAIDTIMIQLMLAGEIFFDHSNGQSHVQVGDMIVFDLGQPLENFNTDYHNISLLFPRDLIEDYVPYISNWHGQVLPRELATTQLLKNHIISVLQIVDGLEGDQIAAVQQSLIDMVSLAFQPAASLPDSVSENVDSSVLMSVKRFVREHLDNPKLGIELLCLEFNLSRSQLYRITQPLGGLKQFIRRMRLIRCMRDLRDPRFAHLTIAQIAYQWGFSDISTFNRNFKGIYNVLPKDVRNTSNAIIPGTKDVSSTTELDRSYEGWVRSLG